MAYQSGGEEIGDGVPTRSPSSGEGEMEWGVTQPPSSPPRMTSSQTGPSIRERWSKHL
jgi:hypothetical protein